MTEHFCLVDASDYVNRITLGRLTPCQVSRSLAFMRARKLVFYDTFSKAHVLNTILLPEHKKIIVDSLKLHYDAKSKTRI